MPVDLLLADDPHKFTELAVALGLSFSVFASTAVAAFSYVSAKVQELKNQRKPNYS